MVSHKKIVFFFIVIFMTSSAGAQNIIYSFDNCDLSEENGILPPGNILGDPECICGLKGKSYYFNGNDTLTTLPQFADLFIRDSFTFDVYFTIDDKGGEMDIFSVNSLCNSNDSTMYLRYFSTTSELFFVLSSNINNILVKRTSLDKSICWHRFTLVKVKTEYFYYIDNKLIERFVSRENVALSKRNPLRFGANICNQNSINAFNGQMDEISWSNRPLSQLELLKSYRYPDQIITRDTTIFAGSVVNIVTGNTCAPTITWSPTEGLDLADFFNPVASPEETVTYTSTVNYRHCNIIDTVRIYVVNKDDLDCSSILLPKAFTPNNDGLNDTYGVSNLFILEDFEFLEVLDRSGSVLWRTEQQGQNWNGTFKGENVSSGVYFYKIKYTCNSEKYFKIDSFSLIR